jgi:CDP-glucose 4,6-dehydratase
VGGLKAHFRSPKPEFWKNRRVFITGHTGFKGSWLLCWLRLLGARVCGYALSPATTPSIFDELGLSSYCEHNVGRVEDFKNLQKVISDFEPEVVFHMAAQALVIPAYESPVDSYMTNTMGTVHLLEACRPLPSLLALVNVTTDKVYSNQNWAWGYRETDPLGGHDPYSSSKAASEIVTEAYRHSYFKSQRIATCRAGNVIGGGDWSAHRLLPDCARAFSRSESVKLRNPHATRPWQHVIEPLRGYLLAAEEMAHNPAHSFLHWNFGPQTEDVVSVKTVIKKACEIWGENAKFEEPSEKPSHAEAKLLKLDCSKAQSELDWSPRMNLDTAIRLTFEWYKAFYTKADPRDLLPITEKAIMTWGHQ